MKLQKDCIHHLAATPPKIREGNMKMWKKTVLFSITIILALAVCVQASESSGKQEKITLNKAPFGKTADGKSVDLYTFENANGVKMSVMTYGGIITSLLVPDKGGQFEDIVLGFDSLEGYLKGHPYFGALIGRYGNRIAKGKFPLGGKEYSLFVNNDVNALHGGKVGFDKRVWNAKKVDCDGVPGLELTYTSPDGEEGYPGTLKCKVIYSLNNKNELKLDYFAETNKPTPLNLTNHTYFNLTGNKDMESILDHELMLNAKFFTPVDETLIPTGEITFVKGAPFDFTEPMKIGARINADDDQIKKGGGYDHNFVLNKTEAGALELGGRVVEPKSGRVLEFFTTQPGVQFYTGNFLDGANIGKGGQVYKHRFGFCMETQHFPDSPNHAHFPSTILKPGESYHETTIYKFSTK